MATYSKLTVYNTALLKLGQRRLSGLTENQPSRHKLDTAWDSGPVEYCLDLVKPHWATAVARLNTPATSSAHDLDSVHSLPADYLALVEVYSDAKLDQRVHRYLIQDRTIVCEFATVYVRYVKSTPATVYTNWTPNFHELVSTYVAQLLVDDVNPTRAEMVKKEFVELVEASRQLEGIKEPPSRSAAARRTVSNEWLKVYNDALQIAGLPHMVNAGDDTPARTALDVALENDLVLDLMEEANWNFAHNIVQIYYDPSLETDFGYTYAHNKPEDIVRLRGIFQDEYLRAPLRDYDDIGENIFCDLQIIYLDYIASTMVEDPSSWPASFRKLVAARMCYDARSVLARMGADVNNIDKVYEQRLNQAKNSDAMQSPPRIIRAGSWVRARTDAFRRNTSYLGRP